MTATIPAAVETARDYVSPAIAAAVDRLSPDIREVAAYHLGLPGRPIRSAGRQCQSAERRPAEPARRCARRSRCCRPARLMRAPERAVPAAVAVELVHNFSLLHDDIMDGDTERRHRPTAWTVYGVGSGDPGWRRAAGAGAGPAAGRPAAGRRVGVALPVGRVQRLIAGQGADLAFERRGDVTVAECLDMAGDKTAALMACACSIGAVYVGGPANMAKSLAGFGAYAGLAFQLTDDLLGIWGAPEVTGKPVRSDLRARKKSLPVVAALTSGTQAGRRTRRAARRAGSADRGRVAARGRAGRGGAAARSGRRPRRTPRSRRRSVYLAETDMPHDGRAEFEAIAEFVTARQW